MISIPLYIYISITYACTYLFYESLHQLYIWHRTFPVCMYLFILSKWNFATNSYTCRATSSRLPGWLRPTIQVLQCSAPRWWWLQWLQLTDRQAVVSRHDGRLRLPAITRTVTDAHACVPTCTCGNATLTSTWMNPLIAQCLSKSTSVHENPSTGCFDPKAFANLPQDEQLIQCSDVLHLSLH